MHPPSWLCKELYGIHKRLRMAWHGPTNSFALIQLMHESDVGKLEDPKTALEFWTVTDAPDDDGVLGRKRIDRGPIFNRHGGTTPDWNMVGWYPMFIADMSDYGVSNYSVWAGSMLATIKRWMRPIGTRVRESAAAKGKELKAAAGEIAEEATEHLWREATKSDATSTIVPQDVAHQETKDWMASREKEKSYLENYYSPDKKCAT